MVKVKEWDDPMHFMVIAEIVNTRWDNGILDLLAEIWDLNDSIGDCARPPQVIIQNCNGAEYLKDRLLLHVTQ